MSFFEPPPPPPEPPRLEQPEWVGPPDNVLGAAVPMRVVVARTPRTVVAVTDVVAYPNGFEVGVAVHRRVEEGDRFDLHPFHHPWPQRGGGLPPEFLRFGVELADGSKATNVGMPFSAPFEGGTPEGPVLVQRGGGGGGGRWDFRYWIWPLPPPGRLDIVVEWPSEGIELTRTTVDADAIRAAAAEAETLWPGGGPSERGGSFQIELRGG